MKKIREIIVIAVALVTLCGIWTYSNSAVAMNDRRVKIATSSIGENGCSETHRTFEAAIPELEQLDLTYKGVLSGIEVVVVENNGGAYSNFAFTKKETVTWQLSARGGGRRIYSPIGNGNVCVGATGGNIAIEVWAHYKVHT
jgi:hypothetical protein